jgi:Ciliary basal body-associated, B9 protein
VELPPGFIEEADIDFQEFNREESMTQDCKGKIILNKLTGIYEYVYYFSFPLDYQLICTDSNFHTRGPTLIMQVCHDDQWGRFVLEGYAFCDLPRNPGRHILECSSWRPYESLTSQIKSFFVGGATKVSDLKEVARAHENESVMNRYTLKTITAGKITVEINVCTQNA